MPAPGSPRMDSLPVSTRKGCEAYHPRPKDDLPPDARSWRAADGLPPALSIAVDGAGTGDGDVLGVVRADQRLPSRRAEHLYLLIVIVVWRTEQDRVLLQLKRHIALQQDRSAQVGARIQHHRTAALARRTVIDRLLDRRRILGRAIALGAILLRVAHFDRRHRRPGRQQYATHHRNPSHTTSYLHRTSTHAKRTRRIL